MNHSRQNALPYVASFLSTFRPTERMRRKMRTFSLVALSLALSLGNTLPQGVSPAVTETVPELQILREQHDKAQRAFIKTHNRSSGASIRNIFSRSIHSLSNSPDKANSPQISHIKLKPSPAAQRLFSVCRRDFGLVAAARNGPRFSLRIPACAIPLAVTCFESPPAS
jgi:hypothetical protein